MTMRILVLNGAPGGPGAAALLGCVTRDGAGDDGGGPRGAAIRTLATRVLPGRGGAESMPAACTALLAECGWRPGDLDLIAAVIGPGSFTGLRAALALAHGLALGAGCDLVGVTSGEAMAPDLRQEAGADRAALCLSVARRGRIFVEQDGAVRAHAVADYALPPGRLLLAGDAAADILAARGDGRSDIVLSRLTVPDSGMIARAALARRESGLPARDVLPLYVDPPEARLPAAGLRPAPC